MTGILKFVKGVGLNASTSGIGTRAAMGHTREGRERAREREERERKREKVREKVCVRERERE